MKLKGASPIIATVLLLAITVLAVVGVWYSAQGLLSKTEGKTSATPQSIDIIYCDLNGSLVIKNMEDRAVKSSTLFRVVYYQNQSTVGYFNVSINATQGMMASAKIIGNTSSIRASDYTAQGSGFISANFHCSA